MAIADGKEGPLGEGCAGIILGIELIAEIIRERNF